ncbi:MAG: anti-sigma factor family protein [Janthinobacterium lividum]
MNCHHARQLISPYLDHQLTGREMLALQDHFTVCASCERERHSIRQLKALLRGLQEPRLPRDFPSGIAMRLEQVEANPYGWRVLFLPAPKPQRGRRLASALALSCLTVLSFVAPFAPESRDARQTSSFFGSDSSGFAVPGPSDAILSGRLPERITFITVNDLTRLPSPQSSSFSRSTVLMPVGLETMSMQSGLAMTPRSQENPFGTVQYVTFRPR